MTTPSIFATLPLKVDRSTWLDRGKALGLGPDDPALPAVKTQGVKLDCVPLAIEAAVEYLLKLHYPDKFRKLDVRALVSTSGVGSNTAEVFKAMVEVGSNGVRIVPPIFDCGGFAGGVEAVLSRWPVVVSCLNPVAPKADGWVTNYFPKNQGHELLGYKLAWRANGTEIGLRCLQCRGPAWSPLTKNTAILPEADIKHTGIYAIRSLIVE